MEEVGKVEVPPYEVHALAMLMPEQDADERLALQDSIDRNGLRNPIVLYEGQILDGRHRYAACQELPDVQGLRFETFEGTYDEALEYVLDTNMVRRHLNPSQKAVIAEDLANTKRGANQHTSADVGNITRGKAAEEVGASIGQMDRVKKYRKSGIGELDDAVRNGQINAKAAVTVAKLPPAMQMEYCTKLIKEFEEDADGDGKKSQIAGKLLRQPQFADALKTPKPQPKPKVQEKPKVEITMGEGWQVEEKPQGLEQVGNLLKLAVGGQVVSIRIEIEYADRDDESIIVVNPSNLEA